MDLAKGMTTSQLTDEELDRYRQLPVPKKEIDWATLSPRNIKRRGLNSTSNYQPNGHR